MSDLIGILWPKSESRQGALVLWVTLHTAEGPSPAAGGVEALVAYFARPEVQASCHAAADDTKLVERLVPYDRAAWTLRGGNHYSDNLEMCGYAGWTRAMWMRHMAMVRNAASWAASRCRARAIQPRRLSVAEVRARHERGIIDHNEYTVATGDGTHWDVGPAFPWDLFLSLVAFYSAPPIPTGELSVTDAQTITAAVEKLTAVMESFRVTLAQLPRSAELYAFGEVGKPAVWVIAASRVIQVLDQPTLGLYGLTHSDVHWLPPGDPMLRELVPAE